MKIAKSGVQKQGLSQKGNSMSQKGIIQPSLIPDLCYQQEGNNPLLVKKNINLKINL